MWSDVHSPQERGRLLYKLADAMEGVAGELAALETLDNGKPLFYSKAADVPLSVDHFRWGGAGQGAGQGAGSRARAR